MKTANWIFVLLFFAASAHAENLIGNYSSLHFHEEAGDLLGMELLILPSATGPDLNYTAIVQIAEGGAPDVYVVPLILIEDGSFALKLPSSVTLKGKVKSDVLTMTWPDGDVDTLKKGESYWK